MTEYSIKHNVQARPITRFHKNPRFTITVSIFATPPYNKEAKEEPQTGLIHSFSANVRRPLFRPMNHYKSFQRTLNRLEKKALKTIAELNNLNKVEIKNGTVPQPSTTTPDPDKTVKTG